MIWWAVGSVPAAERYRYETGIILRCTGVLASETFDYRSLRAGQLAF
jgi:hypothetical protein